MDLDVSPGALRHAAAELAGCAARLEAAALGFARTARGDAGDLGMKARVAGLAAAAATEHAVDDLTLDIRRLAGALQQLADRYVEVDRGAVPHR